MPLCDKVLEIDPANVKALFRRAQARLGRQDYELALKDLNAARESEPNDNGVAGEIAKVKKAQQMYKEKEKNIYAKMFK